MISNLEDSYDASSITEEWIGVCSFSVNSKYFVATRIKEKFEKGDHDRIYSRNKRTSSKIFVLDAFTGKQLNEISEFSVEKRVVERENGSKDIEMKNAEFYVRTLNPHPRDDRLFMISGSQGYVLLLDILK